MTLSLIFEEKNYFYVRKKEVQYIKKYLYNNCSNTDYDKMDLYTFTLHEVYYSLLQFQYDYKGHMKDEGNKKQKEE